MRVRLQAFGGTLKSEIMLWPFESPVEIRLPVVLNRADFLDADGVVPYKIAKFSFNGKYDDETYRGAPIKIYELTNLE